MGLGVLHMQEALLSTFPFTETEIKMKLLLQKAEGNLNCSVYCLNLTIGKCVCFGGDLGCL